MGASRLALLLLVALGAALGLAACGGGGGGANSSTASTSASTAGTGSTAPGTAKASPGNAKALPGTAKASPGTAKASPGTAKASPGHAPANAPAAGAGPSHAAPLTRASARHPERHPEAVQAARHRSLAKKAGKAAPFLVPVGDNSIPTYGQESSDSQRGAAEADLRAYLEARAAGEWSAACARMAATVQKQLALLGGAKGEGCTAAYAKLSSRLPASARANPLSGSLTALRVKEGNAFALFYGPKRQQYMMPMVSEGAAWKVNQIEPITWPLGASTGTASGG